MNTVLGRPRNRSEDNIKEHIMEEECEVVGWIHLVQQGGWGETISGCPLSLISTLFLSVLII
jgi:hypothetical protein